MGLGVACADGAALGSAVADGVGDAEAVGVGVGAGAQSGEVRRPSHVRVTAAESPASMRSMRLVGSAGQVVEVHTVFDVDFDERRRDEAERRSRPASRRISTPGEEGQVRGRQTLFPVHRHSFHLRSQR